MDDRIVHLGPGLTGFRRIGIALHFIELDPGHLCQTAPEFVERTEAEVGVCVTERETHNIPSMNVSHNGVFLFRYESWKLRKGRDPRTQVGAGSRRCFRSATAFSACRRADEILL